jgi:uncharacterized delta-60 repeat protein
VLSVSWPGIGEGISPGGGQVLPNGKLILTGIQVAKFVVYQFNKDGSPDLGFGKAGRVDISTGAAFIGGGAVASQADGKLLVVGSGSPFTTGWSDSVYIARLNADGSLDTNYGGAGKLTLPLLTERDVAFDVIVQTDGKAVIAGHGFRAGGYDFTAVRINPNGTLDTTFGDSGKVALDLGYGEDFGFGVTQQADGKIALCGKVKVAGQWQIAVVRLSANGSVDSSFGSGGKVLLDLGPGDDQSFRAVSQPDGKLLIAGTSLNGAESNLCVIRLNFDGTLDTSFGSVGKIFLGPRAEDGQASLITFQPASGQGSESFTLLAGGKSAYVAVFDIALDVATTSTLVGTSGNDKMSGTAGNDVIIGGDGNDTLDGGGGIDSLLGGTGNDTYYVDAQSDVVIEGVAEGTDTVISSASLYLPDNLENLTLTGTAYFGVGNSLDNLVIGSSAENLLLGGAGNDTVRGGDARDAIFGESGNDVLYGDAGIDYIVAGTGNDTIYAGNNADEVYGEDGNDLIYGGDDFNSDILVGGAGNDTIDGGPAWDQMYGGTGDDTFYVSQQVDWVFEQPNEGYDTVIADSPNGYYLFANVEALTLVGTTPFGVGNELNNVITGSPTGNVLMGAAGNDTLDGGAGQDILWGMTGADTFLIRKGTGIDIIADFTPGTDRIDLSDYGFKSVAAARALFQQVGADVSVNLGNGDTLILMGVLASAIGNADIYTGKINTAPVANAVAIKLSVNTQKSGTLTASDIDLDPLTFIKVSDPAHGAISLSANGSFVYTPVTNYFGSDTFSFKVNDGNVDSANAVVTFSVANVNNLPTGSVTISPGAPVDGGYATASNTLADVDGLGTIRYQWRINGQDVAGATGTDFFLAGVAGSLLSVRASYTDGGGVAESVLSQVVLIGSAPGSAN